MKLVLYFFILICLPFFLSAQQVDSLLVKKDSLAIVNTSYQTSLQRILKENTQLNSFGKPLAMKVAVRKQHTSDSLFYMLLIVVGLLSFLRFNYTRYFNNLFRVFFNTSLRQSQLTDQLLQAKLPSLFFNIFYLICGGLFVFMIFKYFNWVIDDKPATITILCVAGMAVIYLFKFIALKFTGWVTGYAQVTNMYLFVIFLINKILGILLLPLVIIMAFSISFLVKGAVLIAFLLIAIMFLLRFVRSYSLLLNQLKIGKVHFFIYILGMEIMPFLLIYKGLVILLAKD